MRGTPTALCLCSALLLTGCAGGRQSAEDSAARSVTAEAQNARDALAAELGRQRVVGELDEQVVRDTIRDNSSAAAHAVLREERSGGLWRVVAVHLAQAPYGGGGTYGDVVVAACVEHVIDVVDVELRESVPADCGAAAGGRSGRLAGRTAVEVDPVERP